MKKFCLLFIACACVAPLCAKGTGDDEPVHRNAAHRVARSLMPVFDHIAAEEVLRGQQLRAAAQEGRVEAARTLLIQGVRQIVRDQALIDALEAGHDNIAILLLNHGAQFEVNDFLAMRMAINHNQVAVLRAMLAINHAPDVIDALLVQAFGQSPIAGIETRTLLLSFESTPAGRNAALRDFGHSAMLLEDDEQILPALGQLLAARVSADVAHEVGTFAGNNGYPRVAHALMQYR